MWYNGIFKWNPPNEKIHSPNKRAKLKWTINNRGPRKPSIQFHLTDYHAFDIPNLLKIYSCTFVFLPNRNSNRHLPSPEPILAFQNYSTTQTCPCRNKSIFSSVGCQCCEWFCRKIKIKIEIFIIIFIWLCVVEHGLWDVALENALYF